MNADLESEMRENPELRAVVDRLRAARTVEGVRKPATGAAAAPRWGMPLAASLALALAFAIWLARRETASAFGAREYRLSPDEMIASQRADGSWQNDFLTRRNAEILGACDTPAARVAYKKAMRNLRIRGIL